MPQSVKIWRHRCICIGGGGEGVPWHSKDLVACNYRESTRPALCDTLWGYPHPLHHFRSVTAFLGLEEQVLVILRLVWNSPYIFAALFDHIYTHSEEATVVWINIVLFYIFCKYPANFGKLKVICWSRLNPEFQITKSVVFVTDVLLNKIIVANFKNRHFCTKDFNYIKSNFHFHNDT